MFVGRKEELSILEKRYNSDRFEFGYLYGQRRIGKTSLIDEFSKGKKSILLFASDSDDYSIRADFTKSFYEQTTGDINPTFDNWEDFFKALASYFRNDRGLLVIDEYPNIVLGRDKKRKKTDFVSKLQNAIDHEFQNTKILFIITGSNVSFMESEINDTSAPLYKRHTFELMLSKLEWEDACSILDKMDEAEKARVLSLTDTFPYYLAQINPNISFEGNVRDLFFSRDSLFVSDPSKLITSDIVMGGFYTSLMRSIAEGCDTVSELSKRLKTDSSKIAIYLEELVKVDAIIRCYNFGSTRMTYYKIVDRMCAFYFRFIFPNSERIKLGYGNAIMNNNLDKIDSFVHYSFESLCITYLEYLNKNGKLDVLYDPFTNYKVENSKLGRSVEIDIVSTYNESLLVGECKFSKNTKGIKEFLDMQEDTSIAPFDKYKNKNYYIFSASGFDESIKNVKVDENISLHLIDLKEMFKR